jgi:hypothetical protein
MSQEIKAVKIKNDSNKNDSLTKNKLIKVFILIILIGILLGCFHVYKQNPSNHTCFYENNISEQKTTSCESKNEPLNQMPENNIY